MLNPENTFLETPPIHQAETSEPRARFNPFYLLFRPKKFFESANHYKNPVLTFLLIWMIGILFIFDVIERMNMGFLSKGMDLADSFLMDSWGWYWIWSIVLGFTAGWGVYVFHGLWYRIRLRFCGVKGTDLFHVRRIFIYSYQAIVIPFLFYTLAATALYDSPLLARESEDLWMALAGLAMAFFMLWSVYVTYRGVRVCFGARKWLARVWFFLLPGCIELMMVAVLGVQFLETEEVPQTSNPESFEAFGMSFEHPGNWYVNVDEDTQEINIEPIQDAYLIFSLQGSLGSPKEQVQTYLAAYYDLQAERADKTVIREWGSNQGYGYRFRYIIEDIPYTCTVFAGNYPNKTFLFQQIVSEDDEIDVMPGLNLIEKSFRFQNNP